MSDQGERGATGATGARGRGLSVLQTLAVFLIVVLVSLVLSWRSQIQQRQIQVNTADIVQANYARCMSGVLILSRFNEQQDALAGIERELAREPGVSAAGVRAAAARVKAYEAARVLPLPVCTRPR